MYYNQEPRYMCFRVRNDDAGIPAKEGGHGNNQYAGGLS